MRRKQAEIKVFWNILKTTKLNRTGLKIKTFLHSPKIVFLFENIGQALPYFNI